MKQWHLGAHKETEHLATLLLAEPVLGQDTLAHNHNDIWHELVLLQNLVHHRHGQIDNRNFRLANLHHANNRLICLEYNTSIGRHIGMATLNGRLDILGEVHQPIDFKGLANRAQDK